MTRFPTVALLTCFLLVGVLNTAFGYAIYSLGLFIGFDYVWANLIALIIGIAFSFKTQGALVFRNTENSRIVRFVMLWAVIYLVNIFLIAQFLRLGLNPYVSGALAIPLVTVLSFAGQKLFVFSKVDPTKGLAARVGCYRLFESVISLRIGPGILDKSLIVATWVVMLGLVHPYGNFPINDDWVYAASVRSILAGRFEVYGFSSANLGVLAYLGTLATRTFGFSFDVLRSLTIVLGIIGSLAIHSLFERVWKNRLVSLVAVLTLIVNPVFFASACTFMTDVPFLAFLAVSMALIVRGIAEDDDRVVLWGLVVGLVAVTIRQFAVIVFVGYFFAHQARRRFSVRSVVVGVLPLVVALTVNFAFNQWLIASGRKPGPTNIATVIAPSLANIAVFKWSLLTSVTAVGAMLMPLALLCVPSFKRGRTIDWTLLAGFVLVTLMLSFAFIDRQLLMPIGENILQWYGIGPLTNGDSFMRRQNLPIEDDATKRAWALVTGLTILASASVLVSSAIAMIKTARRLIGRRSWLGDRGDAMSLFVFGTGLAYCGILVLLTTGGFPIFDRYLLPLVLIAGLILPTLAGDVRDGTIGSSRMRLGGAMTLIVVIGAFTVIATHDFFAWSRARWTALDALVASGISPHRIDGGYEFNGWNLYDPAYQANATKNFWWVDDDEFIASSGPVAGYRPFITYPVERWWKAAGKDVHVLRRE